LEEEAVYFKLINFYYDTEKPIPVETKSVFRRLRLTSKTAIVNQVLQEFFVLEDDGWHHLRCDSEIAKYHNKAETNREVGKLGGRPKKNKNLENPQITQMVSQINPQITLTTNQEPLTTNQEPLTNIKPIYVNIEDVSLLDCPHEKVISLYHNILPELRQIEVWNETRKGYLKQRWREVVKKHNLKTKEEGLEYFSEFFRFVRESNFLMGKIDRKDGKPFQADLEWILRPTNFAKIIERKYHQ
jgi:uncharacterized protein YdaU (DUF1376 family)